MKKKLDFLIIGAGLTGLTISYLLSDKDAKYKIIESRSRLGGRIFTKESEKGQRIEMGATWLGYKHKHLISLLKDLKLEVFDQAMGDRAIFEPISTSPPYLASLPPNNEPSLRIKGGSSALINALKNRIDDDHVSLNEKVTAIRLKSDHIEVVTDKSVYHANKVISTLPPYLAVNTIKFDPVLPEEFLKVAKETHTWMGESIKVAVSYETPFWRKDKKSATIFSNVGPVGEMYEHNDFEDSYFVLKGFMNGSYYSLTTEERKAMILNQLQKYFGPQVYELKNYEEKVWRKDANTFYPYQSHILPHDNNGHRIYKNSYFEGRLVFGGSETSSLFPGYMEGAVYNAQNLVSSFSKE